MILEILMFFKFLPWFHFLGMSDYHSAEATDMSLLVRIQRSGNKYSPSVTKHFVTQTYHSSLELEHGKCWTVPLSYRMCYSYMNVKT